MSQTMSQMQTVLAQVKFNADGLVNAIAQDSVTSKILMVAWMDRTALQETIETSKAVYFSRSRQKLWRKGEESGHTQTVLEIRLDCDGDVVLLKVEQQGGIACHTGREHCFFRRLETSNGNSEWVTTDPVLRDPSSIYGAP
jgi:phosphoribosyl-AMP cyclohydrolase